MNSPRWHASDTEECNAPNYPLIVRELCSSTHPSFFSSSNKIMVVFIESLYLSLTSSVYLSQNRDKSRQVSLEFCHISVTKRNDHWRRTWLNYGKICLLRNAEHRLPKYVVNDWPFFTDECTKKYAAIWLLLCMKWDPIAPYHWRMILCPWLIS